MWLRKVFLWPLVFVLCLAKTCLADPDKSVTLPRLDRGLFMKEMTDYTQKKRKENVHKWVKRGAVSGAVVLGVGVLGVAGFAAIGMTKKPKEESLEKSGFLTLIKNGLFLSIGGGIGCAFLNAAFRLGSFLFSDAWSNDNQKLFPYAARIKYSLVRLLSAMDELSKTREKTFLYKHYFSEVTDSLFVLERSLEKFCAVLLCELEKADEVVANDAAKSVEKLFLFCDYLVQELEHDLNEQRWSGFKKDTCVLVEGFESGCLALLPKKEDA